MGVLGKDLVVACSLVVAAGGAGVEEQRLPFWEESEEFLEWWLPPAEGVDQEDDGGVWGNGGLVLEDGEHAPPPLLQQQQELQAAPPQEPWLPPMAAGQEGSGAGSCGESGLGLEGFSTARLNFPFGSGGCCDVDSDGLRDSGGGGEESYTTDGRAWERAGIGTGRSCSRVFWGCEVAGRRLRRQRRVRVREK